MSVDALSSSVFMPFYSSVSPTTCSSQLPFFTTSSSSNAPSSLRERKISYQTRWDTLIRSTRDDVTNLYGEMLNLASECDPELKDILKSNLEVYLTHFPSKDALEKLKDIFLLYQEKDLPGYEILIESTPLDLFENILHEATQGKYASIEAWAKKIAERFAVAAHESHKDTSASKNSSPTDIITSFFPNLAHIFLRTFNLFDSARPPESLYEYGVLMNLYFQFFAIPYYLILALGHIIGAPLVVFVVATSLLAAAVGGLYIHLKYFRKCPTEVTFCENLSNRTIPPHQVLGRDNEYQKINQILGINEQRKGDNVVIVGSPGVGKTEFMEGLAQRLQEYKVFKFKNWVLFGAGGSVLSAGEKMDMALKELQGFEDQVVVLYDELGDGVKNSGFADYLKLVLPSHKVRFVAAMTAAQWEKFKSDNSENGFEERFTPFNLQPTDDATTKEILLGRVKQYAEDLFISEEAIDKIIEITKNSSHAQPRASIRVLDEIIGKARQFDIQSFETSDLQQVKKNVSLLENRFHSPYFNVANASSAMETYEATEKLKAELENKSEKVKKALILLKKHLELLKNTEKEYKQLALTIAKSQSEEKTKRQFAFAQWVSIPALRHKIQVLKASLPPEAKNTYLYFDALQVKHLLEKNE